MFCDDLSFFKFLKIGRMTKHIVATLLNDMWELIACKCVYIKTQTQFRLAVCSNGGSDFVWLCMHVYVYFIFPARYVLIGRLGFMRSCPSAEAPPTPETMQHPVNGKHSGRRPRRLFGCICNLGKHSGRRPDNLFCGGIPLRHMYAGLLRTPSLARSQNRPTSSHKSGRR